MPTDRHPVNVAGRHGFHGAKSGTLFLAPGLHAIQIDYSQVLQSSSGSVLLSADRHGSSFDASPSSNSQCAASSCRRAHRAARCIAL